MRALVHWRGWWFAVFQSFFEVIVVSLGGTPDEPKLPCAGPLVSLCSDLVFPHRRHLGEGEGAPGSSKLTGW